MGEAKRRAVPRVVRRALRWGDVPVPYTAIWSDEVAHRRPFVRRERWGGQELDMLCEGVDAPTGKPVFKILHADRTREVVRHGLCQMCLSPLPSRVVTVNQDQRDRERPLISDGLPMCPACAAAAFRVCPGMQRQHVSGDLRVWASPRGAWLLAPVLLGLTPVSQGGDPIINALLMRARRLVFTGPKLVLTSFEPIDALDLALGTA